MFDLQPLENRRLLAWGTYPQLIRQDDAVASYPSINGSGVNIAVIDSGVDFNHASLAGKFWTNPGEIAGNGIDDDSSGYIDDVRGWDFYGNDNNPEDQNGHGTAISGIIAANQFTYNGATYGGIAPGAKLIPLKISDPTGAYSTAFAQRVEKALQWVETNYSRYNIRIVNMSVRTPVADYQNIYADEISRLANNGVMIIAAGGQEDPDDDVVFPAADANAYGISVVNSNNTFPTGTVNRGPGIDLLAPGNGVPILLRGGGFGVSALATSYSTPFATGAAALVKQIAPNFTSAQIMSVLKDSGVNVTDTSTGWTYSGRTYKRLDVFAAIQLAEERKNVGSGTGSITGVVFFDANGNGIKNKFERTAIAGQLYLDLDNDARLDSGEPSLYANKKSGAFTFSNLSAGTFSLRQIPPKGYRQTLPKRFYSITVGNGQAVNGIAFGDTNLAYVAGFVFNDINGGGTQNKGEPGMSGWVVWLDDGDGVLEKSEQSLTTDSVGSFIFRAVPPGTYTLRVLAKAGWTPTTATRFAVSVSAGGGVSGKLFGQQS